ncbi:hypothetical protein EDD21DRAFT_416869 [Dissophora ornata]|nr:hypothetical protein EDD21DRAFT_416869 [Dissophora ornata]
MNVVSSISEPPSHVSRPRFQVASSRMILLAHWFVSFRRRQWAEYLDCQQHERSSFRSKRYNSRPDFNSVENTQALIHGYGISQTSLEEVFLKLIRNANPEGY